MSAKKLVKCDACNGLGRKLVLSNGTVIDSTVCQKCLGSKKMPKPKK